MQGKTVPSPGSHVSGGNWVVNSSQQFVACANQRHDVIQLLQSSTIAERRLDFVGRRSKHWHPMMKPQAVESKQAGGSSGQGKVYTSKICFLTK